MFSAATDDDRARAFGLPWSEWTFHWQTVRALITMLIRLGQHPVPGLLDGHRFEPWPEFTIDALLRRADESAEAEDTTGVYAALWLIAVLYPRSLRGWAEFARAFADRGEWEGARLALSRAFESRAVADAMSADAIFQALAKLAAARQLGDIGWRAWIAGERLPRRLRLNPHLIDVFSLVGDDHRARTAMPWVMAGDRRRGAKYLAACRVAYEQEKLDESYRRLRQAFELDLEAALSFTVRGPHAANILQRTGRADDLAEWLAAHFDPARADALLLHRGTPEARNRMRRRRREAIDRGLPSAMLCTLWKSGSITIGNIISSGFPLSAAAYSLVHLRIVPPWLGYYLEGGATYTTHLMPSPDNVARLAAAGVKNVTVHVRDPRQVLISAIEHDRLYPRDRVPSERGGAIRQDFDGLIDRHLMPAVDWIKGWVEASAALPVAFTTFEEFVTDRDRFVERLLAAYGGDTQYFDRDKALSQHEGIDYHHRLGAIDEWRSRCSADEIDMLNRRMPDEFWRIFGWTP